MTRQTPDGILVVKLGGGLTSIPGALESACAAIGELARRRRVVVVPGGGPFAGAVREFDQRHGLSDDAAHWMAILAMDQYAHVLAQRIERAALVEEPGGIGPVVGAGRPAVLAPYRWMRSADVLPHSWEATSDSVAAFIAGALDATHLVLVKPRDGPTEELVDGCFSQVVPKDLSWTVLAWDRLGESLELLARPASS